MNPVALAARRAFNEALRARMRSIATERSIPDADMKWLGRLRHVDLAAFVQKHNLSWHWVLGVAPTYDPPMRKHAFQVIQGGLR